MHAFIDSMRQCTVTLF